MWTKQAGIAAVLIAGLGVGALAAVLNAKPEVSADSRPDSSKFAIDSSNTPGFPKIKGGDFDLVDHNGNRRNSVSPDGKFQLLFFGYSNCKAICSLALPNLAEAVDLLEGMNAAVTPILITVDPKRDTVETLNKSVADIHPNLVGLTGSEENLDEAYKAFNLEKKFLFEHVDEGAVYSHGSFIYLLGPDGSFKTLFAPVISPVRIAEISAGYIAEEIVQN
ncbi:MAG: SCO family protein [Rhizobiaceae bacterium]|nr:SCO family protein [Rhizobiaceae bacterium]